MAKPIQVNKSGVKTVAKSSGKAGKRAPARRRFPLWIPGAALGVVIVLVAVLFFSMMRLEETDTFCGSCHTQPETTYLDRMAKGQVKDQASAGPVDVASFHQSKTDPTAKVHCIDCHAGPGLAGRVAAIFEGAGNAVRYVTHTGTQPGKLAGRMPDANCVKCHADVTAAQTYKGHNNHYHFFLARLQAAAPASMISCAECHLAHNDQGDTTIMFLQQAPTEAVCSRCHSALGEGGG